MITLQTNNLTLNNFSNAQLLQTVEALPRFGFFEIEGEIDVNGHDCTVTVNNDIFFNGKITSIERKKTNSKNTTIIATADNSYNAYESDCISQEFEKATINQIARNILSPYRLTVKTTVNPIVDTWATFPTDSVYTNLNLLAERNGLFIASNGLGEVSFFKEFKDNKVLPIDSWPKFCHFKSTADKKVTIYHQDKTATTTSKMIGDITKNYILPIGSNADLLLKDKKRVLNSQSDKIEITFDGNRIFDFFIGEIINIEGIVGDFFVFKKDFNYSHYSGYTTNLSLRGV